MHYDDNHHKKNYLNVKCQHIQNGHQDVSNMGLLWGLLGHLLLHGSHCGSCINIADHNAFKLCYFSKVVQ